MSIDQISKENTLYKSIVVSSIVISVISLGIIGFLGHFIWIGPRCTTCFFHFNIDYRLGDKEVEDRIIREPYFRLLKLYEKHPNWDFTVECQAEMILQIYNNKEYEEIEKLTDKLLERNQMELMCVLQFSQLFYAYPSDVFELNLKHANETLKTAGILNKRSNCILFQEGQYAYGLGTLLNSPYAGNVDTVLVSAQQIKDFQRSGYSGGNYPVYMLKNYETGKTIKLLQYDYLPQWEAGYFHSWNYLFDAELAFEDEDADEEFTVSEEKIKAYEQELLMLERQGNVFFTCSEWVAHCKRKNAIGSLDYYMPECNWTPTNYNSSYTWAANNKGSADDGEILANNYRCRQIILATRIIYEKYKRYLGTGNKTLIEARLKNAERLWLQATCSDSTGLTPRALERITAEGNVLSAQKKCAQILQIIAENVATVNVSRLQVDLKTKKIYKNSSNFISLVRIAKSGLTLADLPVNVDLFSNFNDNDYLDPHFSVSLVNYDSLDATIDRESFNLFKLDVIFEGTHDWADDSIHSICVKFSLENKENAFREIVYSPSLLESETKRMIRDDYIHDPLYIFLPLSNGMIFIPNKGTNSRGIAIVKDVTVRHTCWLWEMDHVEILETNGLHLDAHHRVYILENVTIDRALNFANRINVHPPWIVSKDASLIQGNEVYNDYEKMKNKLS